MATYDFTNRASGSIPNEPSNKPLQVLFDFAVTHTDNTTGTDITSFAAGDILKLVNVAKGTQVNALQTQIMLALPNGLSATGGTAQTVKANIGDSGSATRYNSAVVLSQAAGTVLWGDASTGGTWSSRVSNYYSADDYIKITLSEAVSKGQILLVIDALDWNITPQQFVVGR